MKWCNVGLYKENEYGRLQEEWEYCNFPTE